jgi:ribokinase
VCAPAASADPNLADRANDSTTAVIDVCVVGSANLDLVATTDRLPGPGETVLGQSFAEHAGGKGLNQAVAAARAGASTSFCAAVGTDDAARQLLAVMKADGIDARSVRAIASVPTGRALIGVSAQAENSIIVVAGANGELSPADVTAGASMATVVLAQLEVPLATVEAALQAGRDAGATTILNPAPARPLPANLIALCDVIIPNEHEVELLGGVDALFGLGARAVVVTLGSRGAQLCLADGTRTMVPAFAVDPVDTTAAGDAFCGAFAAAIAAKSSMIDALRFATAGAALATTRAGAVPSLAHLDEIRALLDA